MRFNPDAPSVIDPLIADLINLSSEFKTSQNQGTLLPCCLLRFFDKKIENRTRKYLIRQQGNSVPEPFPSLSLIPGGENVAQILGLCAIAAGLFLIVHAV